MAKSDLAEERAFWTEQFEKFRQENSQTTALLIQYAEKFGNLAGETRSALTTINQKLELPFYKRESFWRTVVICIGLFVLSVLAVNNQQCLKVKDIIQVGKCAGDSIVEVK